MPLLCQTHAQRSCVTSKAASDGDPLRHSRWWHNPFCPSADNDHYLNAYCDQVGFDTVLPSVFHKGFDRDTMHCSACMY
jgi:hypothetical protein